MPAPFSTYDECRLMRIMMKGRKMIFIGLRKAIILILL